jgi:hypothetical protein
MTTPKVSTISRGGSRFYVHPESQDKVPGVTSVVGMLPKPFLRPWAAKVTAETAVDHLGEIVSIALRDRQGAIDFLKRSPDRFTKTAADVGTEAHDLFERLAKGESVGRVHPDFVPFVEHFESFLEEFSPEFVFMEETVWSEKHSYAGSFDAFAVIDGERVWVDYKTTRSGVHEEVALQLAAYRYADYIIRPDGGRVPMPEADAGAVLHVRPEGWSLVPIRADEKAFETFLHLRAIFEWERNEKGSVIGDPVNKGSVKKKRATPRGRS